MYRYDIPCINGKPIINIPDELRKSADEIIYGSDKVTIFSKELVDAVLYYPNVKVIIKSLLGEYSYPGTADVIITKDDENIYAFVPANNWKGYRIIDNGEAGTSLDNPGDDAKVIQSGVDYINSGVIVIADKIYLDRTLYLKSFIWLTGRGYNTGLFLSDDSNCDMVASNNQLDIQEVHISNIRFFGNNYKNTIGNGINFSGAYRLNIENVWFENIPEYAIHKGNSGENNSVLNCHISKCGNGIRIDYGSSKIKNNIIANCINNGIYCPGGAWQDISHNYIYGTPNAIVIKPLYFTVAYNDIVVGGNYHYGIRIQDRGLNYVMTSRVQGNIISLLGSDTMFAITTEGSYYKSGISIVNNTIEYSSSNSSNSYIFWFKYLKDSEVINNKIVFRSGTKLCNILYENNLSNIKYEGDYFDNENVATITGDGTTTSFTVNVAHQLFTDDEDRIVISITPSQGTLGGYSLVDTDGDGFKETLQFTVNFSTAPASGTVIPISWSAKVV